jgi:hypothetical protein
MIDLYKAAGRYGDILKDLFAESKTAQPDHQLEARLDMLDEFEKRGQDFKALSVFPCWKTMEKVLRDREQFLLSALRHAPPKDVLRLQAQLEELEFILNLLPEGIAQGEAASRELAERSDVDGNE